MRNSVYVVIFFLSLTISCSQADYRLLIEAESFNSRGGWLVDPQFVEQMGSPYLLAHGLGNPVENARTMATPPSDGRYQVWVRTKNWAPGQWEAPGRFQIIVNGEVIETILGTEEGWGWQYAGSIRCSDTTVTVELKDLTGFEARCDAVYFTSGKDVPPDDPKELSQWRRDLLGEDNAPPLGKSF
ncbi:MAG: hypothetical protein GYA41_09470, partial [Bacteroidales bacterium]|nr:hypothetical protein [Bacteroidales bacterium]